MTTPGYPDWQSPVNWRGPILSVGAFTVTSIASLTKSEYVTNFASLSIIVKLTGGIGVTVTAQYYSDSTLANPAGSYTWILGSSPVTLDVTVPNKHNFVVVTISTAQAGNQTGTASFTANNLAVEHVRYPVTADIATGASVSINAGATLTTLLPYVVEGDGQLFVLSSNATDTMDIEVKELNEGANQLADPIRLASVTSPQNASFKAGPYSLQFSIKNNGAAAHTFTYHCVVRDT